MSEQQPHGSETKQGPGWWIASDNRWYAPELHPDFGKPTTGISSVASPGDADSSTDTPSDTSNESASSASSGLSKAGAAAAAGSAAMGGAITADSLSSSASAAASSSAPLPTVDSTAATTPPTYGSPGATTSLPSTDALPSIDGGPTTGATTDAARSVFSSDSATRTPAASAPKITTPPLTSTSPSPRSQAADKASFEFSTPEAAVEPTTNVPAGTTSIIAGLLSILGSFMLWANDTGSEIPDFLLVRRVAAFDSNGPFTLLIGVGLVIVGALLMFGQKPLWLWSVLSVLFGTIVLACVIWSYVDITGRASDDWAEYVAAATGTPESTVSALGVGLKTSLGLWITGFGGLLGVLTAPLARRGA